MLSKLLVLAGLVSLALSQTDDDLYCNVDDSSKTECLATDGNSITEDTVCIEAGCCWSETTSTGSACNLEGDADPGAEETTCDYCWDDETSTCYYEFAATSCFNGYDVVQSFCDNGTDWNVDYVGKSGQFKLYPCEDSSCFIKVNILSFQEYGADGSKNGDKITSFSLASADFASQTDGDGSVYQYSDDTATTVGAVVERYIWTIKRSGGEDESAEMNFTLWLLDRDEEVHVNNEDGTTSTYVLRKHSLKISLGVNWPIADADGDGQALAFSMRLTTGGDCGSDDTDTTDEDHSSKFAWGDSFSIESALTAEIDGESKDVQVDYDYKGGDKHADVTYTFTGFDVTDGSDESEIFFDPWILGSFDSANSLKFNVFVGFLFSFVLCIFMN
jgi:hypothetical protein